MIAIQKIFQIIATQIIFQSKLVIYMISLNNYFHKKLLNILNYFIGLSLIGMKMKLTKNKQNSSSIYYSYLISKYF